MKGINFERLALGGLAGGILIWICEGAASSLYLGEMQAALRAHNLSMELNATAIAISIAVSLVTGFALVFFYAASRARFGPGPKTAVIVAVTLWLAGYVVSLSGLYMFGLFGIKMLAQWAAVGLVEMVLAALLGGWLYREA